MTSTSYVWRPDYEQRKAFGHSFTGSSSGRNRIPQARAASSLETTAGDYARFLLATVRGVGLSPELHRQMLQRQTQVERGCVVCLGRPVGPYSEVIAWGLGIGLAETPEGPAVWHFGDNQTMQGYAAVTTDGQRGVVILANSANGLSIAPEIASSLLGLEPPGYEWLARYASYRAPAQQLLSHVVRSGLATVTAEAARLPRSDLVAVAERLLNGDRPLEAVALMSGGTGPRTADEYALVAEALRLGGKTAEAQQSAAKAVKLEPTNGRALQVVERLRFAERIIPAERLALYAGRYSSPFGPLQIKSDGKRLTALLLDQPPSVMLPLSDNSFLMERVGVPIEFAIGPDGRVTHATVRAGGEIRLQQIE